MAGGARVAAAAARARVQGRKSAAIAARQAEPRDTEATEAAMAARFQPG